MITPVIPFEPLNSIVPLSCFWNPFVPPKVPAIVNTVPPTTSNTLFVLVALSRLNGRLVVKPEVARKVDVLMETALVGSPRTASFPTAKAPLVMATVPEKELAGFVNTTVPRPDFVNPFVPERDPLNVRFGTTLDPVAVTTLNEPPLMAKLPATRRP